ncbi:Sorbitol dehydrogenase [Starkeya nomas]|uniref:Sorbitol dehydrogenase n=2 Tax=Xanthobacteraceae TaxID=335928 RepID=A0A5S9PWI1_9HYPH|nr:MULTISPECIES: 2,3-butanediol dehydrogenase [Xanthobacteraceae]TSJ64037.1 2,3-butanediol dehydrogenase [Ancylobacter moscoviensis]CAA0108940.1 Sorbitol dehydrogenase [Starkeya nomas]
MKAARFHGKRDVRVENLPEPDRDTLGPHEVLIRNRFCGICGTDLHEYAAGPIFIPTQPHPYTGAKLPQVLGHEYGGTVIAVGPEVSDVAPGDKVSVQPLVSPRDDYFGRRGLYQLSDKLGIVGLMWPWGGMAEYSVVNDYNVFRMPDSVSDEQAALIEPTAVAVYAADRGGVKPGSSVLVTGAGPIGQLQVLAARAAGASRIFLSDTNDNRLAMARQLLPDVITLNPKSDDVVEAIRDQTEGHVGVDVALECVGAEAALATCIEAVRRQGVVVQVGLHVGKPAVDGFTVTFKDIDVRGSWCYSTLMWPRVASMIGAGILPAEKVVTRRIRLDDVVRDGFEALLSPAGTELKILIDLQ